jgi:putative peptidoglycan lipid II flippase
LRVVLTTILGYLFALPLPHLLGIAPRWGVAGLTISAGISSWVEFTLLRRALNKRLGQSGLPAEFLAKLWAAALLAAAAAWGVHRALGPRSPIPLALVVLGMYGAIYFAATLLLKLPEAQSVFRRARISVGGV